MLNEYIKQEWHQSGHVMARGYAWWQGELLTGKAIAQKLNECQQQSDILDLLKGLNGLFACYGEVGQCCFAAVDIVRSIPLFYHMGRAERAMPWNALQTSAFESWYAVDDGLAKMEFVEGHETLHEDWQQLRAGECWFWTKADRTPIIKNFLDYQPAKRMVDHQKAPHDALATILEESARKLAEYANGKTIVIPLSGGYDSRLILASLVKIHYPRIATFTYGDPDSYEVQIAEKVAKQLGVSWQFVHYTTELFSSLLDADFQGYFTNACNGVSVPQEQDYFALRMLLKQNPEWSNAVFAPGYCGDFHAGSFIPDDFYAKKWKKRPVSLREYAWQKHVRNRQQPVHPSFMPNHIEEPSGYEGFLGQYEEWLIRERIAKYTANGLRAYEHFGLKWYLPLWDHAFHFFSLSLPYAYRQDRKLYNQVCEEQYFKPLGISFKAQYFDAKYSARNWRSWMRNTLPTPVKTVLKNWFLSGNFKDVNNLDQFSHLVAEQMGKQKAKNTPVNQVLGEWVLHLARHQD